MIIPMRKHAKIYETLVILMLGTMFHNSSTHLQGMNAENEAMQFFRMARLTDEEYREVKHTTAKKTLKPLGV